MPFSFKFDKIVTLIILGVIHINKYLIVNADDFGLCESANKACMELFETGNLLSSTIMMVCPGAEEAVKFAIDHPEYAIGVHTTLTAEWQKYRWKPLTDGKSLLDKEGFMWHESDMVELHAKSSEVEAEIRAQIDKAHAMGMKPSHIDNHMGSLYGYNTGRFGFLKMALRICHDYGYAYRVPLYVTKSTTPRGVPYPLFKALTGLIRYWVKKYDVITPDYLIFPDWKVPHIRESYESYRRIILDVWTNIPDGVTETFIHPAVESDELKGITNAWQCRVWEYELMKDPYTHQYLKDHGIEMITYRDLIKMKSK